MNVFRWIVIISGTAAVMYFTWPLSAFKMHSRLNAQRDHLMQLDRQMELVIEAQQLTLVGISNLQFQIRTLANHVTLYER